MPSEGQTAAGSGGASAAECLSFMREYQVQLRVCEEQTGILRNIVKRGKAAGVPTTPGMATVRMSRRDPEEVRAETRQLVRMMALRGIIGPQTDFLSGLDLHVPEKVRADEAVGTAEENGYRAGRSGETVDANPHPAGSEYHAVWAKWWANGQAAIAKELGANAKKASTAKAKPGGTNGHGQTQLAVVKDVPKKGRGRLPKTAGNPPTPDPETRQAVTH
jgi:hypothetical protein